MALVSDGSSGIGAATVRRLAAAGWDVSFCHRGDEQAVRQVEKAVSELGGRVLAVEVDVTNAADVTSWFQQAHDELGPVQAAVSCAGMTRDQPLARLEEADWRAVLDTGLDGMFHICRAAMLAMMKHRSGRIVAVSSVCGAYDHSATHDQPARQAPARQAPARHWPVRAGMAGFVPALSALTSRFGVSVNAVTPGPATHDMTAILPEPTRADLTETIALRRFDDASDVADLVTFLLSPDCDITGRVLEVRSPISLLRRPARPIPFVHPPTPLTRPGRPRAAPSPHRWHIGPHITGPGFHRAGEDQRSSTASLAHHRFLSERDVVLHSVTSLRSARGRGCPAKKPTPSVSRHSGGLILSTHIRSMVRWMARVA